MSAIGGPNIVDDGLVLALDAANVKSIVSDTLGVDYLLVGGGGAGGFRLAGGGGGGGVLQGSTSLSKQSYTITVGNGGTGMTTQEANGGVGNSGGNSSAFNQTATGGGGGGGYNGSAYVNAASGGSGGGGASASNGGSGTTGQGTAGRNGNSGGISSNLPSGWSSDNGYNAGGGGGAGTQGTTGTPVSATGNPATAAPSNGGDGILSDLSGTPTYYGGGGGGHQYRNSYTNASGGLGGGGRGGAGGYSAGQIVHTTPTNGQPNTGGGGGGGGFYSGEGGTSGAGGSGIVIIRYNGPQKAKGGTVTKVGNWIIHTFTSSGTFEVGNFWGDISLNGNSGELVNGPTFSSANLGSLVFDGVDDYITIPSFTFTPYCLDFWVYNNNEVNTGVIGGPSTYQTLIHYPGGMVSLGAWTGAATDEVLHIWSFAGGGRLTYTRTVVPINNHNWVFNWNGSNYDIWVDGIKQTVYAGTSGHALLGSLTNSIRLGNDTSTYYFNGKIYSFKLYTSQLSDSQVLQNYNATKGRFGL
jgi:hypothetical protein